MNTIVETERLIIRELDSALDAEFIFELLNSPKFLQFIGDRGVRTLRESAAFIDDRYRQSYRDHGFGLYTVELRGDGPKISHAEDKAPVENRQIGMCGFVKRDHLEFPDIGFAFLPQFEQKGYGFESASALMGYGRNTLGFGTVLAITTLDNVASGDLLKKLGFRLARVEDHGDGSLNVYESKPS